MTQNEHALVSNSLKIYEPEGDSYNESGKKALIIVPDLELNGAQTVLFSMIKIIKEEGYHITLISSEDGPYRDIYLTEGYRIVIRPFVVCDEEFKEYMRRYDLVFLNSSSTIPYMYFFINTKTPVILWLHETKEQLVNTHTDIPHPLLMSPNIRLAGVTSSVLEGIRELYDCDIELLPMAIPDEEVKVSSLKEKNKTVEFFIPAAYTYIKGQDILLSEICRLPRDFADIAHFTFCGYKLPGQEEYYNRIKELASKMNNVTFLEQLSPSEVYGRYRECDCVIAPSRIDATPTTIVEAMMFKKIVLVSSNAGISKYLTDCVNGFVFNDPEELFKRLLLIIDSFANGDGMARIAESGYDVYTGNFSPAGVSERLKRIMNF